MFWTGNQCIFLKALGQEDQRLQHGRKHPESEFAIGFHIVKCHEGAGKIELRVHGRTQGV